MTEITEGMQVIRKTASTQPIVGTVEKIVSWQRSLKPITVARIHWKDSTRRWNGGTDTTSTLRIDTLIPATEENIANAVARSKRLTPVMKAALSYWKETYGDQYMGLYDAANPLHEDRKKQRTYEKAFEKLASLGYLEPNPDNRGKGSASWTYRVAQKED